MTLIAHTVFEQQHPWHDCFVQGGKSGVVVVRNPKPGEPVSYWTAFVEAFPRDPKTFIRGEGATVPEAEDAAWAKYQKILHCPAPSGDHEYETRGMRNGVGFCRHCNMSSGAAFTLEEIGSICVICGTPSFWTLVDGHILCEQHVPPFPRFGFMDEALRIQEGGVPPATHPLDPFIDGIWWQAGFMDMSKAVKMLKTDWLSKQDTPFSDQTDRVSEVGSAAVKKSDRKRTP